MRDRSLRPLSLKHISPLPGTRVLNTPLTTSGHSPPDLPIQLSYFKQSKKGKTENMSIYVIHHYLQLVLEGRYCVIVFTKKDFKSSWKLFRSSICKLKMS